MRAGQEAAIEASRRRAALANDALTRQELAAHWAKQSASVGPGLPPRLTDDAYYERADREARELDYRKHKQKKLEERRNKLTMMFFHENMQYREELKIHSTQQKLHRRGSYLDAVPTSVLRDINLGIKAKEDQRRRQEAEITLYHQWRANQPVLKEYERSQRHGALKSAWMEQAIEKDLMKKEEEEKLQKILGERDSCIKRQMEKEKEDMLLKEEIMKDLREQLCHQIDQLRDSEKAAADLRRKEEAELNLLQALQAASIVRLEASTCRAAARGMFIGNMSLYARRLRERAREAERDVEADQRELAAIILAIEEDAIKEETGRQEWREALIGAQESLQRQRELEKCRQKRLEDAMDGEARVIFQKQEAIWQQEHAARQALLDEVLTTLKMQVKDKLMKNKEEQKENILELEIMLESIELANKEMEDKEIDKQRAQQGLNKMVSLQTEMRQLEREEKEIVERKQREKELRDAAREEERLRCEIIRLQREGCGFQTHRRRRVNW